MSVAYLQTPLGIAFVEGDTDGIQVVSIKEGELPPFSQPIPEDLAPAVRQLSDYFNGQRTVFELPLNPQGTEFQKRVWQELLKVPFGRTGLFHIWNCPAVWATKRQFVP